MTTNTTLLPCPHCGASATFHEITDEGVPTFGGEYIQCGNSECGCCTNIQFPCMTSVKPLLAEIWNERRNPDTVPRSDYDAMLAKAWELAEALKKIVNKALDVRTAHNEAYENCAVDDLFEHTMDSLDMNQIILTSFTTAYPEKGEKSEPTS